MNLPPSKRKDSPSASATSNPGHWSAAPITPTARWQDVEKGLQLCSQSCVSLRRTEKRTPQSPHPLRPRFGKGRVLARLGWAGVKMAFLNILRVILTSPRLLEHP